MTDEELNDKDLKSMAENIYLSGRRLLATLNSILELAQLSVAGVKLDCRLTAVADIIEISINEYRKKAESKGLKIFQEFQDRHILAYINDEMFRQVINKLIDNAIKFTKEGFVSVELLTEQEDKCSVTVIRVRDTGIGIDPANSESVFHEFMQVSRGYGRSFEGSGLGLTVARKVIGKMGGRLELESSQLNKGSTFTIKLPSTADSLTEILGAYEFI